MSGAQVIAHDPSGANKGGKPLQFAYDYAFSSIDPDAADYAGQDTCFDACGVDVLGAAWTGYNSALLAYGQTGAGKSFRYVVRSVRAVACVTAHPLTPPASMTGSPDEPGIMPRVCEYLFHFIEDRAPSTVFTVEVRVS